MKSSVAFRKSCAASAVIISIDLSRNSTVNLAHLLVGSEGTLGLVVEAKLRLIELPRAKALLVVQFANLLDALEATPAILAHQPAAVEVMDHFILASTKLNAEASRLRDFLHGDPEAILIIEFFGDAPGELPARLDALETDLRQRKLGCHYHRATDPSEQARIWKLRTLALGLSMAEKGDAKAISFVEDTAVAPEHLRDYIAEFLDLIKRHGTTAGVYAHASVGCLHVRPVINLKTVAGVEQFAAIAGDVADLVLKYGGALSGEHGDGLVRSPFQEKMFGAELYQAFRTIKQTFDPRNLFNPGKIVDAPPLTNQSALWSDLPDSRIADDIRFQRRGRTASRHGTVCGRWRVPQDTRRHDVPVVSGDVRGTAQHAWPSQHLAPGAHRANRPDRPHRCGRPESARSMPGVQGLQKRMSHQCGHGSTQGRSAAPTSPEARLAAPQLGIRQCRLVKQMGLPVGAVFQLVGRQPSGTLAERAAFGHRSATIAAAFCAPLIFGAVIGASVLREQKAGLPPVLLFPDTFTNYHEPEIGFAAITLLSRLNKVVIPGTEWIDDMVCCGRPMISNGMLSEAIVHARHNVERLYPWAEKGNPIVACEPSCILTIKDDYPALLRGELARQARAVAERCFTFEDHMQKNGRSITFRGGPKHVLFQDHCHQRSLVGSAPSLSLLRRLPETEVIDLDAGCCGMAGSFGYEKEHYDISRLVGEQRLFPAVRAAAAASTIVASGFSCRLQIEHFTGRKAVHPAILLAAHI